MRTTFSLTTAVLASMLSNLPAEGLTQQVVTIESALDQDTPPKQDRENVQKAKSKVTFHVLGMMKAKSGAT